MSTWGIGDRNDSEEVRTLKEQLRTKDAAQATTHSELLKREEELKELKATFDNALQKLRQEADRVVQLDSQLKRRNEELSDERVTRANAEAALTTAERKLKESEQTTLELQTTVHTLSSNANSTSRNHSKLESDNAALQTRVLALERELQSKAQAEEAALRRSQGQSANSRHRRQPSDTAFRLPALEKELVELRATSAQQVSELQRTTEQLTRTRETLVQVQNEKTATERRLQRQLDEAQAILEDREEDLRLLRSSCDGEDTAAREAGLLERLEQEETRVAALEEQLARSTGSKKRDLTMLQDELERTMQLLDDANKKAVAAESRLTELARERDMAVRDREHLQREQQITLEHMQSAEARISELELQLSTSDVATIDPMAEEATVTTIERLLGAIERLRGERDGLRRDIEFLNLEHKFAVQALEEKLTSTTLVPRTPAVDQSYVAIVEGHAQAFREQAERSERAAIALAIVAQHATRYEEADTARIQELVDELSASQEYLRQAEHALERHQYAIASLQEQLASSQNGPTESETTILHTSVQQLEEELLRERKSHAETGAALSDAEAQLTTLSDALTEAESARDALALEKSHLETDLEAARNELADVEERHSEQLATLSAAGQSGHGAQAAALRAHIRDLEDRVMRRTEQIGVHQHDIKRLELNMKLQEERIVEMTQELEVFQSEKIAMLEDCRTTREERDDAMSKYDELEEEMEALEEAREREVEAMVRVTFDAMTTKRDIAVRLRRTAAAAQDHRAHFKQQVQAVESAKTVLAAQVASISADRDQAAQSALEGLTSVQAQLDEASAVAQVAQDAKAALESQVTVLRTELETKDRELVSLQNQLAVARVDHADRQSLEASLLAQEKDALEEQLRQSQTSRAELEALHQETFDKYKRVEQELTDHLAKSAAHSESEKQLHEAIAREKTEHAEEAAALEEQLKSVSDKLEGMARLRTEADASLKTVEDELALTKQELETQLAKVDESLDTVSRLEAELEQAKAAHDEEVTALRGTLDAITSELQEITRRKEELEGLHERVLQQSEGRVQEVVDAQTKVESLEAQLVELRADHAEELHRLKERLAGAEDEIREAKASADQQQREAADDLERTVQELNDRVGVLVKEVDEYRAELDEEKAAHARTKQSTTSELREITVMRDEAEAALAEAEDELPTVRAQLEHVESCLREMEEEKLGLQYQTTNLEAEVQRAKSLQRFLESQVSDSERQISSLETELAELRTKHTALDKFAQTREANLAMQTIQHEQTIATLRRELNSLRTQPSAEDEIAELKEKNTEYEELLRAKCLEIEENDDRFIDMLKEKKKLNSKIDSLTRKVENLQKKLAAETEAAEKASQAAPAPIPAIAPKPPAVFSPSPDLAPAPIISGSSAWSSRPTSRQRVVTAPAAPPADTPPLSLPPMPDFRAKTPESRLRMMSGPSSINRPKTPDSRVPMPVFKARTPERHRNPTSTKPIPTIPESSSSSSMIGVKRRAPDDFDDCSTVPVQTFTADSLVYDAESGTPAQPTTPRLRKALQSMRTGFTPTRRLNSRAGPSSPRRATTGTHAPAPMPHTISDVTNSHATSPRAASHGETKAVVKKGWLGKIKAAPSHTSRAFSSRQPTYDSMR